MKNRCPAGAFCLPSESSLGWRRGGGRWGRARVCRPGNERIPPVTDTQEPAKPRLHLCFSLPQSIAAVNPRFTGSIKSCSSHLHKKKKKWNSTEIFRSLRGSSPAVVIWRMLDGQGPFLPVYILCVCVCVHTHVCVHVRVCMCLCPWHAHTRLQQGWGAVLTLKVTAPHSRNPLGAQRSKKQFDVASLFASRNGHVLLLSL